MAIVLKDRVKQTAAAPGTGTITLGATTAGFQAFSAIGNGNVTYFAIVDPVSGAWEVNYGTYTSSGTTLSRNATPLSSSSAGALVNFVNSVDVFCTYPSEKAIYEETTGNVLIDGGPITVIGTGVTTYTTFGAALAEMYANVNSFAQLYAQNLSDGAAASTDIVAYNDLGDGTNNFIDMGIASSNYSEVAYPIFTPGSGYLYNDGGELIIGSATDDVVLFAGGVDTTDEAVRINKTTLAVTTTAGLAVGGTLGVTGAASFSSTVALSANPTTALQAATKQYVDNQVTAGIHIHEPVLVATTGNLTATYTGGGTNANIIQIANGTDITFFTVTPSVGDQFYIGSSSNGLIANTAYFVVNIVSGSTIQASLTFGGAVVTGLTNGSVTIPSVINSGVGATLTNSGAQAALSIDSIALSTTNRVLVRNQTSAAQNGVYTVTTVGSGATNWVLTRATDANRVIPTDPDGLGTGDYFFVQSGTLGAGDSFVLTTEPNTMIIGYTALTYTQFSGGITYTGGTNIDVTGQVISVTGSIGATNGGTGQSTVTTGDLLYGSAANTWSKLAKGAAYKSLVMDASATNVEWNAVALNASGAVSGTLPATNGGTGLSSYTLGDTVYSSAANTLSALAGNTTTTKKFLTQTGTGAVSAAPAWGTIDGADVTGNISGSAGSVANALTLGTYLTGTSFNGSAAVTATVDATSANTASKVVARDVSGNFSAGTITATLSGNATNVSGTVAFANGGTGETTRQAAMDALAGATTSGSYLRGNGTDVVMSTIQVADVPTLNQNTSGNAATATTATNLAGGATGSIPYQSAAGTTVFLADVATGNAIISGGVGVAPSYGKIALTTHVSGVLPVANGGTNASAAGITAFNNITGYTASGATGTTSTNLVFSTSPTLVTPVLGTPTSGDLSNCTADGTTSVGFRTIPQNAQTGSYTLVLADSGKHIYHAVGAGAATYTIPANSSVAYPIGTALSFVNLSTTSISIAITTDTMYLGSTGTTGTRTLANYGTATALKVTSTVWIITGSALT